MSLIHITNGQSDKVLATIPKGHILFDEHEKSLKDSLETFEFITFGDKKYSAHLGKKNRAIIPEEDGTFREFVILGSGKHRGSDGILKAEVYTSASYLLLRKAKVIRPQSLAAQTSETAVAFSLADTEWQPGIITFNGIRTFHIESYTDPFTYLKNIAREFELELRFRIVVEGNEIVGRFVDLLPRIGDWNGREAEFGKDLITISRKENTDNLVTALVGVGPEREDGTRLEVFVEDKEALERWGKNGKHFIEHYEPETSDMNMTEERLTTLTKMELNKRVNAVVEYQADIADLEHIPGMENKKIRFGDTIKIKDLKFEPPLYLEARVHNLKRSIVDKSKKRVELGDFIEYTEEEVNAVWKFLREQIKQKVSLLDVLEVTYTKESIDSKDESVYHDGTHYSDVVSNTAKEEAIETAAGDATEKANLAEGNAKSHAELKAQEARFAAESFAALEAEAKRILAEAYADGIVSAEEQARINDVQAKLLVAQQYAENKASEAELAARQYADQKATEAENSAKQYSQAEIEATEQAILTNLNNRIGDVNEDIGLLNNKAALLQVDIDAVESSMGDLQYSVNQDILSLQNSANDLLQRVNNHDSELLSNNGRLITVEQNINTITGRVDTTVSQLTSIDGIVSSQQATLSQHAGLIEGKASQTSVNTLTGRVETAEGSITTIAGQVSLKANAEDVYTKSQVNTELGKKVDTNIYNNKMSQLDVSINGITANVSSVQNSVTDVDSRLTSAQSQINVQVGLIAAKAEKTDVYTKTEADGKVSTAINSAKAEIKVTTDGISQSVSAVNSKVDGIQIGGRNLSKTDSSIQWSTSGLTGVSRSVEMDESISSRKIDVVSVGGHGGANYIYRTLTLQSYPEAFIIGQEYTISFYMKADKELSYYFVSINTGAVLERDANTSITTEYQRYVFRYRIVGVPTNANFHLRLTEGAPFTVRIHSVKIEKGNKATDWTPAPEDTDQAINSVQQFASSIDQKADSIQQSVTSLSQTVTSQGTRLSSAEATITTHATSINLKANATDVYTKSQVDTAVNGRVSTSVYNTKMGQLDVSINAVTTRVSNTETSINGLTGELNTAQSQIASLDVKADGINASVSEVRADLDNLEIGGRNLLPNTRHWETTGFASNSAHGTFRTNINDLLGALVGQDVTFSFDVKIDTTDGTSGRVRLYMTNGVPMYGFATRTFTGITNEYQRVTHTTKITKHATNTGQGRMDFYGEDAKTTKIYIRNFKMEKGNVATDWTPSPEDVDASIDALGGRVSTAEATLSVLPGQINAKASQTSVDSLTGRMNSAESSLSLQAGQISARVEKNGVIGAINLSSEQLKIDVAKVSINGDVEVSGGNLRIKQGIITNSMIASTANIDFAKISNVRITNAMIDSIDASKISTGVLRAIVIDGALITGTRFQNLVYSGSFRNNVMIDQGNLYTEYGQNNTIWRQANFVDGKFRATMGDLDSRWIELDATGLIRRGKFSSLSQGTFETSLNFDDEGTLLIRNNNPNIITSVIIGETLGSRVQLGWNGGGGIFDGELKAYSGIDLPNATTTEFGLKFPNHNTFTVGDNVLTAYGNRATGDAFRVRSHFNSGSYRNDLLINAAGNTVIGGDLIVNGKLPENVFHRYNSSGSVVSVTRGGVVDAGLHPLTSSLYIGYHNGSSWYKLRAGQADSVVSSSEEDLKESIVDVPFSSLEKISEAKIYKWRYKDGMDHGMDGYRYGLVIGRETPMEVLSQDGKGVDHLSMISLAWDAISEVHAVSKTIQSRLTHLENKLEDEINDLKIENQLLKGRIKQLEANVA